MQISGIKSFTDAIDLLKAGYPEGTERIWRDGFVHIKDSKASGGWKQTNRRKLTSKKKKAKSKRYTFSQEEGVVRFNKTLGVREISVRSSDGTMRAARYSGTQRVGSKAPTAEINQYRKKEKKHNFSKDEGVIRQRGGVLEIGIRGEDGKIRPRTYKGKKNPGAKAPKVEIALYRGQVTVGRPKLREGSVWVKDGEKRVVIFDKEGKPKYLHYVGPVQPVTGGLVTSANTVPENELDRLKAVHFGDDEPKEYPKDYSDLVPFSPVQISSDASISIPKALKEFDDNKPLHRLLQEVTPGQRYEITLSRMKGSKTSRPWFKGAIDKIGSRYFQVRHYQNIEHHLSPLKLRRYVLTPSTEVAYKSRPVRLLHSKKYDVGAVKKTKSGEFVFIESVKERFDIPGKESAFEIHGHLLSPSQVRHQRKRGREATRTLTRIREQENRSLHQFKQGVLGGEDHSLWSAVYGDYLLDRQDRITNMQIAEEKLRNAKEKKRTPRTIRSLDKTYQEAKSAFSGFGGVNDALPKEGFDPYTSIKRVAIDSTGGTWMTHKNKVYYQKPDTSVWTTTTAPNTIRQAVRRGILKPF